MRLGGVGLVHVGLGLSLGLSAIGAASCRDRDAPGTSESSRSSSRPEATTKPDGSVTAVAPEATGAPEVKNEAGSANGLTTTKVERRLSSASISYVRASRARPHHFEAALSEQNHELRVRIELAPSDAPRRYRGAVAFYRLARALGLPLVPAAVERSVDASRWMQLLESNRVAGEVGRGLSPAVLANGTIDAAVFAIGVEATGHHRLGQGRRINMSSSVEVGTWSRWAASLEAGPKEDPRLLRAFVGALVLDYLAGNVLRGGVWLDDEAHTLVLDDNETAFPPHPDAEAVRRALDRLRPVRRFPRGLAKALGSLDEPRIRALLAPGRFETWLVTPRTRLELLERVHTLASLIYARIERDGRAVTSL